MSRKHAVDKVIVDSALVILLLGILILPITSMGILGVRETYGDDVLPAAMEREPLEDEEDEESVVSEDSKMEIPRMLFENNVVETTEATNTAR